MSDSLELEFQTVVSGHMGAGNKTQVLCKGNQLVLLTAKASLQPFGAFKILVVAAKLGFGRHTLSFKLVLPTFCIQGLLTSLHFYPFLSTLHKCVRDFFRNKSNANYNGDLRLLSTHSAPESALIRTPWVIRHIISHQCTHESPLQRRESEVQQGKDPALSKSVVNLNLDG